MTKKGLTGALMVLLASALVYAGGIAEGPEAKGSGSFYLGGYTDVLLSKYDNTETTFALGHFVIDAGAELSEDVLAAAEIEWARANPNNLSSANVNASIVSAYIDYAITEPAVLRAGKFLVPINVYNTRLYPADVAKLANPPFINVNIIPSKWAETGVQLHGSIDTGTTAGMEYAIYLVNGLQGASVNAPITSMKNNETDVFDSDKAVGGRLGIGTGAFQAGLSGYSGAYTQAGDQDITMLGFDLAYAFEAFELRAEFVDADQEGALQEELDGFYVQGAYKFLDKYEAVLRYDEIDTGASVDRITIGGNLMLTDDLIFRLSYEWSDAVAGDGVVGQLALRF